MITSSQPTLVYIVHDFENISANWELTTDCFMVAKGYPHRSLASLNDLHEYVAACGHVFEGVLKVQEGFCKWFESSTETEELLEDYTCEYRLIEMGSFKELQ
ncbi:hypothetical protein EEL30_21940 [Brevibacillus laterosporus]|uniref:Uncharacterized protein n=1 Tax=Brevibacillus laterosporus TaxID=1465 RepID=A0A518VCI6_BRELA|nr:hypothetical protein EEL30_21940 [Brevibacillus laterosporus]